MPHFFKNPSVIFTQRHSNRSNLSTSLKEQNIDSSCLQTYKTFIENENTKIHGRLRSDCKRSSSQAVTKE